MIISIDGEKAFISFCKCLNKIDIEGAYLNTIKATYENDTFNIIIRKNWVAFYS